MKTNSKKYIDGFVIPIKKKNLPAYKKMAIDGAKMWKRLGALEYFECLADDLKSGEMMGMGFKKMAGLKKDETMIFSFIVYKSKAHRDAVNKKMMTDPAMQNYDMKSMPWDMKRFASGGFKTIVEA
jgi:uncharacterized protein YbaA (DUF1428 family)